MGEMRGWVLGIGGRHDRSGKATLRTHFEFCTFLSFSPLLWGRKVTRIAFKVIVGITDFHFAPIGNFKNCFLEMLVAFMHSLSCLKS
jgi:hypothetical protein